MAIKEILVHVDQTLDGALRLSLALDLAARHNARLDVVHIRERTTAGQSMLRAAELGLVPAHELERLEKDVDAHAMIEAETLRVRSEELARNVVVDLGFRSIVGVTSDIIAQHARFADLAIVGHTSEDHRYGYTFGEVILFATGRPVLLVPPCILSKSLGRRVALAWNGSRPAARALTDAMPLIERAEEVFVLAAHPIRAPTSSALPVESIVEHLRRHCDRVSLHNISLSGDRIAEGLQARATALGADLLVAGAYGHPKLWERHFGGVTRDLLATTTLPLLMGH